MQLATQELELATVTSTFNFHLEVIITTNNEQLSHITGNCYLYLAIAFHDLQVPVIFNYNWLLQLIQVISHYN